MTSVKRCLTLSRPVVEVHATWVQLQALEVCVFSEAGFTGSNEIYGMDELRGILVSEFQRVDAHLPVKGEYYLLESVYDGTV